MKNHLIGYVTPTGVDDTDMDERVIHAQNMRTSLAPSDLGIVVRRGELYAVWRREDLLVGGRDAKLIDVPPLVEIADLTAARAVLVMMKGT